MTASDFDLALARAREEVTAWTRERRSDAPVSSVTLADAFYELLREETDLELKTVRNPSSAMFEARWYHHGRELPEFPKPFCAEELGDARLLACAALIRLP